MAKLTFSVMLLMLCTGALSAFGAQDTSDWITYEATQQKSKQAASEQPINLNRAYLGFGRTTADGVDVNAAALGFTKAFGRKQSWLVGLGGSRAKIDDVSLSSDFAAMSFGHAYYRGNTAWINEVGIGKSWLKQCFFGCSRASFTTLGASMAIIHKLSDALEIQGSFSQISFLGSSDTDRTYTVSLGTKYFFSPNFGISLSASRNSEDATAVDLGVIYRI
jgi:hypothetical protein